MLHKFYHSLAIDKLTENDGDYIMPYSKCNKRLMDTLFFISLNSYPICLKLYMLYEQTLCHTSKISLEYAQ